MKKSAIFSIIGIIVLLWGTSMEFKTDIEEEFYAIPDIAYTYITDELYNQGCTASSMEEVVDYYNNHRVSCDSVIIDVEYRDKLAKMINKYCEDQTINCDNLDPIWNEIESLPLGELKNRELDVYCEQDWYQYENY